MANELLKQNPSALLEYLPNELIAQIFSYLNGVDAVFAFSHLNNRFQSLLVEFSQIFDFISISKAKFDIVFRRHDTRRWTSLQLSNDDDTPGQVEYFFQNYFLVDHFSQLQSLSFVKMEALTEYALLSYLPSLTNLTSLKIAPTCGNKMFPVDLPKLKKLVFSSCTTINWIRNFPQIETIEYTITNCCLNERTLTWPLTLKHLKVVFVKDEDCELVQQTLVDLSQLISLQVYQTERGRSYPNGQIWEQLIRSSLPLLKNFKFFFQFGNGYPFSYVERIVASFSTAFYLEKSWFVHYDMCDEYPLTVFDSLPFHLEKFSISRNCFKQSISVLWNNNSKSSSSNIYKNVQTLIFERQCKTSDPRLNGNQVINLIINTSFDSLHWLHLLTKLRHLNIENQGLLSIDTFRLLLDNAPDLYSLAVTKNVLRVLTDNWSNASVCDLLSRKISTLKFHSSIHSLQCVSRSDLDYIMPIFASKCKHLSLCVQSSKNTIGSILRSMSQLHSLHVLIRGKDSSPINMIWLEKQRTEFNHSNCTIVNDGDDYYFWLGIHP